ncbi:Glycerol-3-phosphate dehydrogenase [NAD(P)+] [bacterium HR40]|nr:Glycerol-3-phosphate dehydrogenase [NAD(P)+] [bacterium HR40]
MADLAVIGTGAWGTALSIAETRAGRCVLLWGRDSERIAELARSRENRRDLPGVPLPEGLVLSADPERLAAIDLWLVAVPVQALRALFSRLPPGPRTVVLCAKGVERQTLATPSAVLAATLPAARPAVLSGPSFAAEVARGLPTALTLAAPWLAEARELAARLTTPVLRLYPSDDLTGVELGGALKNVIAIAAGAVTGCGLGENARAAVVTRGLAEIARLVAALGGRRETVAGLSGLGDLLLSATSSSSRNFRFGLELGRGRPLAELTAHGSPLAEGFWTAPAAAALGERLGVELPVTQAVAAVVEGRASVADAVATLLARPLAERE